MIGNVQLPAISVYDETMRELVRPQNPLNYGQHSDFMRLVRNYNSLLAFASVVTQLPTRPTDRRPFVFRIQGTIYHQMAPAFRDPSLYEPRECQFYYMDTALANSERLRVNALEPQFVRVNEDVSTLKCAFT